RRAEHPDLARVPDAARRPRRQRRARRRRSAGSDPSRTARPGAARRHDAGQERLRCLPGRACRFRPRGRQDRDADREGSRDRSRKGHRARRRRLRHQAVLDPRAGRARARAAGTCMRVDRRELGATLAPGLVLALLGIVAVGLIAASLDAGERAAFAAMLAPRAALLLPLWLVLAVGFGALGRIAYRRWVVTPARLAERAGALLAATVPAE